MEVLYWLIPPLRDALMVRVQRKMHAKDATHNLEFLDWWEVFRKVAPRQLIIAGPSIGWLRNVYKTGVVTYTSKGPYMDHADVLIISGTSDSLVSTEKIHSFYDHISELPAGKTVYSAKTDTQVPAVFAEHVVNSTKAHRRHIIITDGRHELWAETRATVDMMLAEVQAFASRQRVG
jgi:alpha-beta hydrolase superfamily lysophospholipase